MTSKFTAMGRLPILSTLGNAERVDDQVQKLDAAAETLGNRRQRPRHVQLELCVGICVFGIAAWIAFIT